MSKARAVFGLAAALSLTGVGVVLAGAIVALTRVEYSTPTVSALLAACERWVFPHAGLASVGVLAAGSLGFAVLARSMMSAWRQLVDGRRFRRRLTVLAPAAGREEFRVVDDPSPQAFCAGLLFPQVYLSTGALGLLSPEQLQAVLAHEAHHVRRRDPLRRLFIRALGDGLFFVPAVRGLGERYAALSELAADEAAERTTAGRKALASALLAFDAHPHPSVVGIAPERVDRLLGRRSSWDLPMSMLLAAVATVLAFGALTIRLLQATDHASVTLPALAAQACMIAMASAPIVLGGSMLLAAKRRLRG